MLFGFPTQFFLSRTFISFAPFHHLSPGQLLSLYPSCYDLGPLSPGFVISSGFPNPTCLNPNVTVRRNHVGVADPGDSGPLPLGCVGVIDHRRDDCFELTASKAPLYSRSDIYSSFISLNCTMIDVVVFLHFLERQ